MNDPFVERNERIRNKKGNEVSGKMFRTRSQKALEEKGAMLDIEIHSNPALHENHAGRETEQNGDRRLTSESTPVEQGYDFATSNETLDREEMSELSDISTKNAAAAGLPTDNTMMHGMIDKVVTSSSFSERVKNTGNFLPIYCGNGNR